jgi:hypothetical protein
MNEDDIPEEDAENDRTLVAENEEENPSPEYRMATITPSANTIPIADEIIHEDDEATLADPTIMTLQTPLPEQQSIKQQNINRLMEKIERQRKAALNRTNQQITTLVTPTHKTPKKLIVSPGYEESETSGDSSVAQQDIQDEQSSSNTTTAEIEQRRIKLEFVFSFIYLIILCLFVFFIDLENKHSNNKYVFYLNERISSHKLLLVLEFPHHLIYLLKVYLKIYVQQIIQLVFHQHLHQSSILVNNKKMIMNNLLKLFKQ